MSPPNVKRGPGGDGAPQDRPGRKITTRKITTLRWTDVAPNEPPADHLDPAYIAAVNTAVESGEIVDVDR